MFNAEIAVTVPIGLVTAKERVARPLPKLGTRNRVQLVSTSYDASPYRAALTALSQPDDRTAAVGWPGRFAPGQGR